MLGRRLEVLLVEALLVEVDDDLLVGLGVGVCRGDGGHQQGKNEREMLHRGLLVLLAHASIGA
jgi:hypothetical protein